jgi:hypothetical protein
VIRIEAGTDRNYRMLTIYFISVNDVKIEVFFKKFDVKAGTVIPNSFMTEWKDLLRLIHFIGIAIF